MREFRIVQDNYNGFEVQERSSWWPFWRQGRTNSHATVEAAEQYARRRVERGVVKYLGSLAPDEPEAAGPSGRTDAGQSPGMNE